MKFFKLFVPRGCPQVLVRYDGYDDGTSTHDVIAEAYRKDAGGGGDTEYVSEVAQFKSEKAALSFIDLFTEQAARDFVARQR